jgi:hypothetical protein
MWQMYYVRAQEIAQERIREAERGRWARRARLASTSGSRIDSLRRQAALAAAGLARRLDECVAREALAPRGADDRLGSAT